MLGCRCLVGISRRGMEHSLRTFSETKSCNFLQYPELDFYSSRYRIQLLQISKQYSTNNNVSSGSGSVKSGQSGLFDSVVDHLTAEEISKVLKVVNDVKRSEDLLKYIIPKKKADELVKIKSLRETNSNTQISSLEEVSAIVGPKNSAKFFCSVLEKPIPMSMNSAMFPTLLSEETQRIGNVLSLIIVGDSISWSLVRRTLISTEDKNANVQVESLLQVNYPFKPRMHFLSLFKEMQIIAKQIPDCDLCVTEEYPASAPSPYMFNFQLQMAQAKAMLLGLLSSRSNPPVFVSIKTIAVAKLFNTFVGSEKVSGQPMVENLINHKVGCVNMVESVIHGYDSMEPSVKEHLANTLLLNLAYWKITNQIS